MNISSKIFQLVKPYIFVEKNREIQLKDNYSIVKPILCGICQADVRYYTGNRRSEALKKKLPMALLHEGIGVIEYSKKFKKGTKVVIIPSIPGYIASPELFPTPENCCRACVNRKIGENHCTNIQFLSSGYDGLAQSKLAHPDSCLVEIPGDIPDEIAVLSELATVAHTAMMKIGSINISEKIAVCGDGTLGYIVAVLLKTITKVTKNNLYILGIDDEKLSFFSEFARTINVRKRKLRSRFSLVFECVGGINAEETINTIIDISEPGARICLFGVSENRVPINTRDILEKNLTLIGFSRSARFEYTTILNYMRNKELQKLLKKLLVPFQYPIKNVETLTQAFDLAATHRIWGKILLKFALDEK